MPEPRFINTKMLLQIIREARSDYSVIREAISNAFDAGATRMEIDITQNQRDPGRTVDVIFADNGSGMDDVEDSPPSIFNFFNIADSDKKGGVNIGEKGVGTKLFFNSFQLEVITKRAGCDPHYWKMDNPVDQLSQGRMPVFDRYNVMPQYMRLIDSSQGSTIRVTGLRVAMANVFLGDDRRTMLLKDYINFFTAAGNIRKYIKGLKQQKITVAVYRYNPANGRPQSPSFEVSEHHIPSENRTPTDSKGRTKPESFVYRFGPILTNGYLKDKNDKIIRKNVRMTILGFIAGNDGHEVESGGHWSKGLFLAKDGFIVRRYNELMTDQSYYNYRIIVNCQDFELNLGRDDFRNTSSETFEAVETALRDFVGKIRQWREPGLVSRQAADAWQSSDYLQLNLLSNAGPNPPANGIEQPGVPYAEEGYRQLSRLKQEAQYLKELETMAEKKKHYEDEIAGTTNTEVSLSVPGITALMFQPKNELSTLLVFQSFLEKKAIHTVGGVSWFDGSKIRLIQHFHEGIDFLCEREHQSGKELVWIEAEFELMNALAHDHPLDILFAVVCWDINESLRNKIKQNGSAEFVNKGQPYELSRDKSGYFLSALGSQKRTSVFVVRKILADAGFSVEPNYAEGGTVKFG